jgi:hypothetical protein
VLTAIIVLVTACSAVVAPRSASPDDLGLPGASDMLPPDADVAHGTAWTDASRRLPAGIDPGAVHPTDGDAFTALSMPFGERPMPPNAPGISGELVPTDDPHRILVMMTVPTFVDAIQWGEQYVLVVRQRPDGWHLSQAFSRSLCTRAADSGPCANAAPSGSDR